MRHGKPDVCDVRYPYVTEIRDVTDFRYAYTCILTLRYIFYAVSYWNESRNLVLVVSVVVELLVRHPKILVKDDNHQQGKGGSFSRCDVVALMS